MSNEDGLSTGSWTVLKTLQWTADYFKRHGISPGRPTAELLLAHALGCERIDLYLRYDQPLNADELARFKALIMRRLEREPDAYIVGSREFWSLSFSVTPDVLIPRPETECLVEAALRQWPPGHVINVLELGTGSGAISVALAHERPEWHIRATDLSAKALEIARHNADRLLRHHRIAFSKGSWFDCGGDQRHYFDLVISNPPYIAREELEGLEPEVFRFEPTLALDGGVDGLASLKPIIEGAPGYLKPQGVLILEIGYNQGAAVQSIGRRSGCFQAIRVEKDYSGLDRVAIFQLKKYCDSNGDLLQNPDF